jgi:hypothetical protein
VEMASDQNKIFTAATGFLVDGLGLHRTSTL